MPYEIKRRGNEHCVYKEGDAEPIEGGCHATPEEAGKHKAALDAAMEQRGERMAEVEAEMKRRGMEPFVHEVPFSLLSAEKQIAFGIVAIPDTPDAQGHSMTAEDIEELCHSVMRRLQMPEKAGAMLDAHHARLVSYNDARIVECWIQREPVRWRLELPDGTIRETDVKLGSMCMATEFGDELWSEVLAGSITGYSPRGWGMLLPAT